jgi:dTDP-glucose 4,6-dehydratase
MKILVTGGLGFIGSNFILALFQKHPNTKVVNVDAELHGSNHKNLQSIKRNTNYKFIKGTITSKKLMTKLLTDCDAVVNFAADSFVDRSISNAESFLNSNVKGVFTILEILRKQKKRLIHISTDEVFGSLKSDTAYENSRFNPSSPYAATKAASEMLINSYSITYDCEVIITRCTNNYGPRQLPEKLIPKTIMLAHKNKKIPIYGTGKNIRDWIHVNDHCNAIMKVLADGKKGESYNIAANNEIDNITIVKKILSIMGKSTNLIEFVGDRPGHDYRYSMSSAKIRRNLKWVTKIGFDDGLKQTIDWYLANPNHWKNIDDITNSKTPWKN